MSDEYEDRDLTGDFCRACGSSDFGCLDCAITDDPVRAMREANAALPDSDPRKITREKTEMLHEIAREISNFTAWDAWSHLETFANALEAYLPPEEGK